MARPGEGAEITVLDEREVTTYPKPDVPAYAMIVTYRHEGPVPRTIFIGLSDFAPGKEGDAHKQIQSKSGPLYTAYLTERAKRIRADIEAAARFKPEVVRL